MSRWTFTVSDQMRPKLHLMLDRAPTGMLVEFREAKRSIPQNSRLWRLLTIVSLRAEWNGKRRSPAEWKDLFTGSLKAAIGGLEVVPGLDGGFMILGLRTSEMTKQEMVALQDWIEAWCAQNGVDISDAPEDPPEPQQLRQHAEAVG